MVHKIKKEKWIKIGVVGVDSGTLLLTDPAYLQKPPEIPSYDELVGIKKSKRVIPTTGKRKAPKEWTPVMRAQTSQVLYKRGHKGAGVITRTGFGDGLYPVFAKVKEFDGDKRIAEVKVKFV